MELLPETEIVGVHTLSAKWGLAPWDALLVGDGSGSSWTRPAGWACVLVEKEGGGRRVCYGGMSCGTSVMAELLPYIHALSWYHEHRLREGRHGVCRVAVVTDCLPIAQQGASLRRGDRMASDLDSLGPLWAAVAAFEPLGYVLDWVHKRRATSALNAYADELSKACNAAMKSVPMPTTPDGRAELSAYDCNADTDADGPLHGFTPRPRRKKARRDCTEAEAS